jgi:hypothetical protein
MSQSIEPLGRTSEVMGASKVQTFLFRMRVSSKLQAGRIVFITMQRYSTICIISRVFLTYLSSLCGITSSIFIGVPIRPFLLRTRIISTKHITSLCEVL